MVPAEILVANGTLYLRARYLDVEIISTKLLGEEMDEKVRYGILGGVFFLKLDRGSLCFFGYPEVNVSQ